jgi:hypothetical protein
MQEIQITDNIVLVQEVIHTSFEVKEKGMVIKLDMENAFDHVRHYYLFQVMRKFGFNPNFIKWVVSCIGGPWITPLVNGRLDNFFQSSRGLKQGCLPLSLTLYYSS